MSGDPPPSPRYPLFAIAGISQVAAPPEPILNVATFEHGKLVVRHVPAPPKCPPQTPLPRKKPRRGRPRGNPDWPANQKTRDRIVNALADLMFHRRADSQRAVMQSLDWHGHVSQIQRVVKALGRRDGKTTWEGLKAEAHGKAESRRRVELKSRKHRP